jgi:hypothetical protein
MNDDTQNVQQLLEYLFPDAAFNVINTEEFSKYVIPQMLHFIARRATCLVSKRQSYCCLIAWFTIKPPNNALNANRHQTQPAKPTQAAVCVSAAVFGNKKIKNDKKQNSSRDTC